MKSLVHLNALRAFEASARHQSFSAAAAELHVTPAAVGQLVRTLEQWLGAPLFHRGASGKARLAPTETAERALPDIRAGLARLAVGLERLQEGTRNGPLTVAVSPAFAAKWLLPRIERFQAECPETDVRLDTNLKPVDFAAQQIDIGVRYGAGVWPGLAAEKLMDEEVYPVCSPELLRRQGGPRRPADLAGETLIHDLDVYKRQPLHGQLGPLDPGRGAAQRPGRRPLPRVFRRQHAQGRGPSARAGHARLVFVAGRWLPQQKLG